MCNNMAGDLPGKSNLGSALDAFGWGHVVAVPGAEEGGAAILAGAARNAPVERGNHCRATQWKLTAQFPSAL